MTAKDRILDAAEVTFAETGFAGSSMKVIAERAGVVKSLIYHYFSSKQDLWTKVVERHMRDHKFLEGIQDTIGVLMSKGIDGAKEAQGYRHYFGFLQRNQNLLRMMAWLNAEHSDRSSGPEPAEPLKKSILGSIQLLQDKGVFRRDIDPRIFIILLMAASEFWFVSGGRIAAWFGDEMDSSELEEKYISSVGRLLLDGMRGES